MVPHFLFINLGNGTFDDVSESSGAAFDNNGMAQSGMGVDAEDVDGDGLPEIILDPLRKRVRHALHELRQGALYDNTAFFGLAADTMPFVKWGTALWTSTTTAGPTSSSPTATSTTIVSRAQPPQPVDYEQIPLLFRNEAGRPL